MGQKGFLEAGSKHGRRGKPLHDGDQPPAEWEPVRPEALRPVREGGGDEGEAGQGEDEGLSQEVVAAEEQNEDEEEEEGRKAVGIPGPERVSKEEREEHERTHLP